MKKTRTRRLAALVCTLALALTLALPASAAGNDAGISVQLDGQALTFTDAYPQVEDQRIFLPFRAVFEAMGADVDYEGATQTVVAVRDGRTLRMVIGAKEATVTEDGVTTTLPMDVAAFARSGRTYVPVRFAAQAFDCAVGWDGSAKTAVIVDTGKLLDKARST